MSTVKETSPGTIFAAPGSTFQNSYGSNRTVAFFFGIKEAMFEITFAAALSASALMCMGVVACMVGPALQNNLELVDAYNEFHNTDVLLAGFQNGSLFDMELNKSLYSFPVSFRGMDFFRVKTELPKGFCHGYAVAVLAFLQLLISDQAGHCPAAEYA